MPRVDAQGYPLRAADGVPVDDLGRRVNAQDEPVDEQGNLLLDPDGNPLAPAPRSQLCLQTVAERFNMQPAQIKVKSNTRQIAYPRQIAMYLTKELTHASLPEIGRYFGGKHHTTVLHSVHKIEELRQRDDDLNKMLQSLIDTIR